MRSQRAQFIMVTLRKVSLMLADHHIGITHAGDGLSRRITDFDRVAAVEMSEELEREERSRKQSDMERELLVLPDPNTMPRVPEALGTPKSLGGLADRAGADAEDPVNLDEESLTEPDQVVQAETGTELPVDEVSAFDSLIERTEEWSEDLEESDVVQNAIVDEQQSETESQSEIAEVLDSDSSEIEKE
jgi:hypothetical protein